MNFELVVFDWDGTLMDSTPTIVSSIQEAARDVGLQVPPDSTASHVIGLGLADALRFALPDLTQDMVPRLVERYRHHYLSRDQTLSLFPGVVEMLEELRARGALTAVATGKNRIGLERALEHSGLRDHFDATRCADETRSKPHPQMLLELMDALDVSAPATVMVGDTTHDLQMAASAGTGAVAVNYGAHPAHELAALSPAHVAGSVPELHEWLLRRV
jgi:phosphoglycolate phosphatase